MELGVPTTNTRLGTGELDYRLYIVMDKRIKDVDIHFNQVGTSLVHSRTRTHATNSTWLCAPNGLLLTDSISLPK